MAKMREPKTLFEKAQEESPDTCLPLFSSAFGMRRSRGPAHEVYAFAVGLCPTCCRGSFKIDLLQTARRAKPDGERLSRLINRCRAAQESVLTPILPSCTFMTRRWSPSSLDVRTAGQASSGTRRLAQAAIAQIASVPNPPSHDRSVNSDGMMSWRHRLQ
jgi:hypothetical protein